MKHRVPAVSCICVLALTVPASPGAADPVLDGQFDVAGIDSNSQIAQGPDGNMWVTLSAGTNDYARIKPDGTVDEFDAAAINKPVGITTGPDGNMWVTYQGGVATFAPATPTVATPTAIAAIASARAITTGPDGNLWTADADVFKIPPGNPAGFTKYSSTGLVGARWIAPGTDGNLWVADFGGNQVVRVTTGGTGTTFDIGGGAQGIASGPGGQVAFSQQGNAPTYIGRLTPPSPVQKTPADTADPFGVAVGPDGAYWVAQFAANNLVRLTPDGQTSTVALPGLPGPRHVAAGPNGTVWVTLDDPGDVDDKVARISGVTAPTPPNQPDDPKAPGGPEQPVAPQQPGPALNTVLTKAPKKVVRTAKRRAKVKVRFRGTVGATFQCRLDRSRWRGCTSPAVYRLKPGKHALRVRATVGGAVDTTPVKVRLRVLRR